ncbi:MAG: SRPBCC domain-containing protein [Rhizobiaceae bacterium]
MSDLSLTVNRRINQPAKKIFDAWLNPEMMAKYMVPDDSFTVPHAEIDAKVGGRFSFIVKKDKESPHAGTYQVIDRYSKIVFTWESPFSAEGSFVTLTFTPVEGGATDVELTHVKFLSEESRDGHKRVWGTILATLGDLVS